MKEIYLIRSAKAEGFCKDSSDFERALRKKGIKDIKTIGSYLTLQGISPDLILSSCALRAQETAVELSKRVSFRGEKHFLQELYYAPCDEIISILKAQDSTCDSVFVIGHNPQLNELTNRLSSEVIKKIPSMGVVALSFNIEEWSDLQESDGSLEFFIYPKQFKYYMPKQIRTSLSI